MQSSVSSGPYDIDTPGSSRHQYSQQQPSQPAESGRSQPGGRTPNSAQSSRRPSRRPSGNNPQSSTGGPPQGYYPSPTASYPSGSNTPRNQDMSAATHISPVISTTNTSPNYTRPRREQRTQPDQSGGPPIPPPPRTSSNNPRSNGQNSPANISVTDRTGANHQSRSSDNRQSSSRDAHAVDQANSRSREGHSRVEREREAAAPNATATAARSRRRGPTSPDGPQRATSTRDPGAHASPENMQSRSVSHGVMSGTPTGTSRGFGDEGQIINRVVVTDPAVDIGREQERLAEAIPGLDISGNSGTEYATPENQQRRRDYSSSATSSSKKETNFGGYILGKTLGEGEFGKVKLGWRRDGSVQVAVKLIRREALGGNPSRLPKIYREINILRGLSHPNIVRLHEMTETDKYIGIVLEYASGGELFDYILLHRYLKDNAARKLFAQLISGVGYLHKKGIVHRDLKLENLLLDRNKNIIITDFGFANTFNPQDQLEEDIEYNLTNRDFVKRRGLEQLQTDGKRRGDLMQTSCGSPCYAAPELVVTDSLYTGRKVDVWSCGVILYAMLAGYLPFDDDPANPEGDNINLLYKYIVSTPLTFPEYVTPHARDLLRRILVPDPRKRADLFEVARHSWLSDYAHVVSHVTSSTTTVGEIANTVVSDQHDTPLLARSASVREPSKTQAPAVSPVSGLTHPGRIDPSQSAEKVKGPRDPKRRTVQVEYVPPSSQTVRGETTPTMQSPISPDSHADIGTAVPKTRARSGSQGPDTGQRQISGAPASTKPLPRDPYTMPDMRSNEAYHPTPSSGRTQQRPATSQQQMAPPTRPLKDIPRSTSDSTGAFAPGSGPPTTRPTTGGSMSSSGAGRLPSRGNSYSQPLAPTVAATNAQGRLAQPKNGKQYHISPPMAQQDVQYPDTSIGRPSTQAYSTAPPLQTQREGRGHKRSNTFGNVFGRSGSIFGGRPQAPQDQPPPEKKYPPTSMKNPIATDSPRLSTDSKRSTSFGFGRKSSDLKKNSDASRQEKSRRFSLLPASFSFKSLAGSSREQSTENILPVSERRQSSVAQQGPPSRGPSRPQTMSYGKDQSRSNSYRVDDGGQAFYDKPREDDRDLPPQQPRKYVVPGRGGPQEQPRQYHDSPYTAQPGRGMQNSGPSFSQGEGTVGESEVSLETNANRPRYPAGFGSYEEEEPRASMQQGRSARGPAVLQKNHRKFAEAYEQEQEPGYGAGGQHAGSSGAARRVMDFFRRRGRARAGDDRV
ncbi:MAG: hypothetical protein Q9208_004398 [Pyrenodesmia sp. 3 TL-2023]